MNKLKLPAFKDVFVLCATNMPEALDSAIVRRFAFIAIGMPTEEDRKKLFLFYLNGNHSLSKENLSCLAKRTEGFSCNDIEKIVATAVTFFYQELYNLPTEQRQKKSLEDQKITYEQLDHVIKKSSPSIDYYQLNDSEAFKQKHNFVTPPVAKNKKRGALKSEENKESVLKRFSLLFFGHE